MLYVMYFFLNDCTCDIKTFHLFHTQFFTEAHTCKTTSQLTSCLSGTFHQHVLKMTLLPKSYSPISHIHHLKGIITTQLFSIKAQNV